MKIFAVLDNKAGYFMPPFPARHAEEARRQFISALANPETHMFPNPDEFALFELGEFVDTTGAIEPHPDPLKVYSGIEALQFIRSVVERRRELMDTIHTEDN